MIKITNPLWLRNTSRPVFSLAPPGTVKAVENIRAAMRVPTTMPDAAVFFIHLSPSFANSSCSSVNRALGVLLATLTSSLHLGCTRLSTS
ncbi:hypothetical protein RHMOL_Rhmol10G0225000 [Rhododendron molle]|uniref:Uncharacterized protein n=1 Tax=Rhododendron molle TaxID=49168 RepID=A0ACC0M650_RHOML|nr:hypothetical protein RHMOL_Rhmol10G0225000 [Rhododendron molle]